MTATETSFHQARRMFFVVGGPWPAVIVGPPGYPGSHRDYWGQTPGLDPAEFEGVTRGYLLAGVLHAYRGADFSADVPLAHVLLAAEVMGAAAGPVATVRLGAIPGRVGEPWAADREWPLADFRNFALPVRRARGGR
jgi:hypothetical protein